MTACGSSVLMTGYAYELVMGFQRLSIEMSIVEAFQRSLSYLYLLFGFHI